MGESSILECIIIVRVLLILSTNVPNAWEECLRGILDSDSVCFRKGHVCIVVTHLLFNVNNDSMFDNTVTMITIRYDD